MATYITFGRNHIHLVNGRNLNTHTVAKVNRRDHAFELFGRKFCTSYSWDQISEDMSYYPKGVVDLTDVSI